MSDLSSVVLEKGITSSGEIMEYVLKNGEVVCNGTTGCLLPLESVGHVLKLDMLDLIEFVHCSVLIPYSFLRELCGDTSGGDAVSIHDGGEVSTNDRITG